jgi:hypothetical protein
MKKVLSLNKIQISQQRTDSFDDLAAAFQEMEEFNDFDPMLAFKMGPLLEEPCEWDAEIDFGTIESSAVSYETLTKEVESEIYSELCPIAQHTKSMIDAVPVDKRDAHFPERCINAQDITELIPKYKELLRQGHDSSSLFVSTLFISIFDKLSEQILICEMVTTHQVNALKLKIEQSTTSQKEIQQLEMIYNKYMDKYNQWIEKLQNINSRLKGMRIPDV